MTDAPHRAPQSDSRLRFLKFTALAATVLALLALLAVVVVGTLSVVVSGKSMEPTLREGDRLEVKPWDRDLRRFDLVEANEPKAGTAIVKRIIGLPGDRLTVTGGNSPEVLIRPAGSKRTYRVTGSPWTSQVGVRTSPCCSAEGREVAKQRWVTVPPDKFWLIGDNWGGSTDSRVFGFVDRSGVRTKLWLRVQPWGRTGTVTHDFSLVPARG